MLMEVVNESQARQRILELVRQTKAALHVSSNPCYQGVQDPIADALGIKIREEPLPYDEGWYIPEDPPVIVLDPWISDADRLNFTFFHEISHHLIRQDSPLYSFLNEYASGEDFDAVLERYCNIGSAEFLIPADDVRKAIAEQGFSMRLVEHLERTHSASKPAIAIQLAQCATHRCFVVVCEWGRRPQEQSSQQAFSPRPSNAQLYVSYASSSPSVGYPIGRFASVPGDHVIATAYQTRQLVKDTSPILFRGGNRGWSCECEAFYYKGRVYAAFNASSPTPPEQPPLFSI